MKVNMFISCLICEIWIFIDDCRAAHHKLGVFMVCLWSCVEVFEEMRKSSAASYCWAYCKNVKPGCGLR